MPNYQLVTADRPFKAAPQTQPVLKVNTSIT